MNKNLNVYGYCIMPNHVHMIIQAVGKHTISEILRDLKKYTAKAIVKKLQDEKSDDYEGTLGKFIQAGEPLKRIKTYKV